MIGSVSGVAREAASGGNRFVFQLTFHGCFMALLAQGTGVFRPKMRIGLTAMGIVAFQAAIFRHGFVGIGTRFDLVTEEAKIVALSGHLESMLQRILIIMASGASSCS